MGKNKKRKHSQYAQDLFPEGGVSTVGLGATLAHLQSPEGIGTTSSSRQHDNVGNGHGSGSESEEWTYVGRGGKRQKKDHQNSKGNDQGKKSKGNYPGLTYAELHKLKSCLKINDLQNLVLYCLADGTSPQWVSVRHHHNVKKAVVLFVPGLEKGMFNGDIALEETMSMVEDTELGTEVSDDVDKSMKDDYESIVTSTTTNQEDQGPRRAAANPDDYLPICLDSERLPIPLQPLADVSTHLWPVKAPGDDKYFRVHSPLHAMLTAHITKSQEEKRAQKETKGPKGASEGKHWENTRTPITAYIGSKEELQENEYLLHPAYFISHQSKLFEELRRHDAKQTEQWGWKDTLVDKLADGIVPDKDIEKGSLTAGRTVLAMDCEMCKVEEDEMALTRISIVGWDGSVVMDELVKPEKPIIDYLTPYSGITEAKLAPITTTLADIQERLLELLNRHTIILGHSLNSDLNALKLSHPYIIDTSILYQHPRGPPLKSSLKWLAQKYLNREIQKGHGTMGHDSIEDARACLDLVKQKCEKGPKWGTTDAAGESIFKRLARTPKTGVLSSVNGTSGKTGAIIDHGHPERNFGTMASVCIGGADDAEVVEGIRRAVLGDPDGSLVAGGGVDFTWARMRDLEALRGWSNDNRHPPSISVPMSFSSDPSTSASDPSPTTLGVAVSQTIQHIKTVRDFLPPCTLLVVYSGTGDPREMGRLQEMQRTFKREYATKKWDELSVKWTDREEQALRAACKIARQGIGFVVIV